MTAIEFESSLLSLKDPLFYFASRFCKSEEEKLDLIQDTFLKAFTNKDKFQTGTNLKAWVFTIMKNNFINQYNKTKKRRMVNSADDIYENENNFVTLETPLNIYQKDEFVGLIDTLGEKYKQPLKMYHDGYKYEEISEQFNLPLGTIKNRIHTARKLLMENYA